jgi:GTPase SAR1 family protein
MLKNYKVVILGEGRVGKTSLLLRYVHNTFSDKQQPTIQAAYLDKKISVGNNTACLAIWVRRALVIFALFALFEIFAMIIIVKCIWFHQFDILGKI